MGSMNAFVDELIKISQGGATGKVLQFLQQSALPAAKQHAGKAALIGAGGTGVLGAQRLGKDIAFAERARSQGYEL